MNYIFNGVCKACGNEHMNELHQHYELGCNHDKVYYWCPTCGAVCFHYEGDKPEDAKWHITTKTPVKESLTAMRYAELLTAISHKWGNHANGCSDNELASQYRKDEADLLTIVKLLEANKIKEAGAKADDLDTILRDEFPSEVWDFIHQEE